MRCPNRRAASPDYWDAGRVHSDSPECPGNESETFCSRRQGLWKMGDRRTSWNERTEDAAEDSDIESSEVE